MTRTLWNFKLNTQASSLRYSRMAGSTLAGDEPLRLIGRVRQPELRLRVTGSHGHGPAKSLLG
jgi:hypothetical protein